MPYLIVYYLNSEQKTYELSDEKSTYLVGRGKDNDIVISDGKTSRLHAKIIREKDGSYLEDQGSTNGTFVNGQRVGRQKLFDNDEILVGDTQITFKREKTISGLIKRAVAGSEEAKNKIDKQQLSNRIELLIGRINNIKAMINGGEIDKAVSSIDSMSEKLPDLVNSCQELERSYHAYFTLNKLNESVNSVHNLRELLNLTMDMVIKIMNADRGLLMLYSDAKKKLVHAVIRKMHDDLEEGEVAPSTSIAKKVFKTGKPVITINAMSDPRFNAGMSIMNMNIRSVICVPLKTRNGIIGVLYVDNRKNTRSFNEKDLDFLLGFGNLAAGAIEKATLYTDLEESYLASVEVLANVLDASDPYTHGHSVRVAEYSVAIAEAMGFSEVWVKNLRYGALLHDIGKIGISHSLINKDDKLTDEEFTKIKEHPQKGFEIIQPIKFLQSKLSSIQYHHEKYDGTGYPDGLKGEDIPMEARIVAVADAFDAMTSTRSYRKAKTVEFAISEIEKNSGKQFDPAVTKIFIKIASVLFEKIGKRIK